MLIKPYTILVYIKWVAPVIRLQCQGDSPLLFLLLRWSFLVLVIVRVLVFVRAPGPPVLDLALVRGFVPPTLDLVPSSRTGVIYHSCLTSSSRLSCTSGIPSCITSIECASI